MKNKSMQSKNRTIPIVKSSKKLPKGEGWTAQDIREAVAEDYDLTLTLIPREGGKVIVVGKG